MNSPQPHLFSAKEVLSGTCAGIVGTLLGHPLDTVKVRLQTQRGLYRGALDCFGKVLKYEGVVGFYRGVGAPLVSLTFMNSLAFGAFGEIKRQINYVMNDTQNPNTELKPYQYFLGGGIAGLFTGFFSTPFELVKLQLQLDNVTHQRYKGSLHCFRTVLKGQGVLALYTGFTVNTIREIAFGCAYFGLYENCKHQFKETLTSYLGQQYAPVAIPIAGGLSGASAWVFSFPLDCIKANIQGKPLGTKSHAKEVILDIWRTRGLGGFYSGVGPSVLRAFIVSSSRFTAFEVAYNFFTMLEGKKTW